MRVPMRSSFTSAILIVALISGALSLGLSSPVQAQGSKRYVVLGAGNRLPVGLDGLIGAVGGKVVGRFEDVGLAIVESSEPSFLEAAEGIRGVQGVAEDFTFELAPQDENAFLIEGESEGFVAEGHDPSAAKFFTAQWNLRAIEADRVWATGQKGSRAVRVAIIDTGIDYRHQELSQPGKIDLASSISFVTDPFVPAGAMAIADTNRHGTFIASLIAAEGISVAGVAPYVTLIAIKISGRTGTAEFSNLIKGIVHATDVNADIINLSLGAALTKDGRDAALLMTGLIRVINRAHARGALVVASAGNTKTNWDEMGNTIKIPAQLPHVVAVSATGPFFGADFDALGVIPVNGIYAPYTDYGFAVVDMAAPGGSATTLRGFMNMPVDAIIAACSSFTTGCTTRQANIFNIGTSFSAAHVSGVAALVDSVAGGATRGDQIAAVLRRSADDRGNIGKDAYYGFGRVNAFRAVTGK